VSSEVQTKPAFEPILITLHWGGGITLQSALGDVQNKKWDMVAPFSPKKGLLFRLFWVGNINSLEGKKSLIAAVKLFVMEKNKLN
jgi:hypothetical protein